MYIDYSTSDQYQPSLGRGCSMILGLVNGFAPRAPKVEREIRSQLAYHFMDAHYLHLLHLNLSLVIIGRLK